jgi:hypothetical protein
MVTQKQEAENWVKEINTTPQGDLLGRDTRLPPKEPAQPLEDDND